jgi:hypothetical protein
MQKPTALDQPFAVDSNGLVPVPNPLASEPLTLRESQSEFADGSCQLAPAAVKFQSTGEPIDAELARGELLRGDAVQVPAATLVWGHML